jgi:hypothetical protein
MKGYTDFVVKPSEGRYDNKLNIDGVELILNTELQNHSYVSRVGLVISEPYFNDTSIRKGDLIILHHNVFRRFRDIRGKEKNSRSFYEEDKYFVQPNQIFAFKNDQDWKACKGFNFVQPIKETKMFSIDLEKEGIGILKYKDPELKSIEVGDLVGFKPGAEYEFIVEGKKMYRVPTNQITIKYEYQGNEEEYNPSWAKSSGGIDKSS